jgi:hypothetical protein
MGAGFAGGDLRGADVSERGRLARRSRHEVLDNSERSPPPPERCRPYLTSWIKTGETKAWNGEKPRSILTLSVAMKRWILLVIFSMKSAENMKKPCRRKPTPPKLEYTLNLAFLD